MSDSGVEEKAQGVLVELLEKAVRGEQWTRLHNSSGVTSSSYDFKASGLGRIIPSIALFILGLAYLNIEWLQIWIAPKLYLIEYAADLVK